MISLTTPIQQLTRVGATTASRLRRFDIRTAADLLWNIPRKHEDLSTMYTIDQLAVGMHVTVQATVQSIKKRPLRNRKMTLTEVVVADDTGQLQLVWFNQPYISTTLREHDLLFLSGEVKQGRNGELQLTNPNYEKTTTTSDTMHTGRIVPHYHLTAGLTQKQLRFLIKQVLPLTSSIEDYVPKNIRQRYNLIDLATALEHIHYPENMTDLERARHRLKFDELFLIMLAVESAKTQLTTVQAPKITFDTAATKTFVDALPFTLTASQKKAAWTIISDLSKGNPMNRLLQGDVGSGKTVVAALAILNTCITRLQSVLLAPTDILAKQHYDSFVELFATTECTIAMLTRTTTELAYKNNREQIPKKDLEQAIANGSVQLIIGTHAVLQHNLIYNNLALVVVDEQHRFGVNQRRQLKDMTPDLIPHFLSMTATPIPRSLALTMYGDLSISVLKEKPTNRKPIITKLIHKSNRARAYQAIRTEIAKGNQAFVICPLVEESDKLGVKSVTTELNNLSTNIFPDLRIGMVHGKLKKADKEQVMADFRNKQLDMLVATAVVEVGVDIPDATIMIIEAAERFGLAQLHQFRGRVGRSDKQSYCYLFTSENTRPTNDRLQALVATNNGFELAETDLKLRGPGDVYGYRQSGLPELAIASLSDVQSIESAKEAAETLLQADPQLTNNPLLASQLASRVGQMHFE